MSEPEKAQDAIPPPGPEKGAYNDAPKVGSVLKHADAADADEALQALANGEAVPMTPEEEKKLLRKIDFHMMPLLCTVYGLNYLDKTTLSYASVMGLKVRRRHAPRPPQTGGPPALAASGLLTGVGRPTSTSSDRITLGSGLCSTLGISHSSTPPTASSSGFLWPNGLLSTSSCGVWFYVAWALLRTLGVPWPSASSSASSRLP
jgi:hypothetical protein